MEVDKDPRASGRITLDRVAQEHMNEGLKAWTPPEPVPSLRNLETNPVRLLMEISLPGLTPVQAVLVKPGRARRVSGSRKRGANKGSRELSTRGATFHLERSSSEECFNRKLQKEHRRCLSQA